MNRYVIIIDTDDHERVVHDACWGLRETIDAPCAVQAYLLDEGSSIDIVMNGLKGFGLEQIFSWDNGLIPETEDGW